MAETAVKASGTGAGRPVDVCFARTGTEWRLPQQAENRFRDTKALLAEEFDSLTKRLIDAKIKEKIAGGLLNELGGNN